MNWKQFLKPDWRKISIFVALFAISLLYQYEGPCLEICFPTRGLPFPIFWLPDSIWEFALRLIIDLFFWYFISCLIAWIYDKVKKK